MAFNVQPLQISQPQAYSGGVDWSPLAKLGEQYKEGVKQDQLADLGKKLADGSINYKQAAGLAADMGNPDAMLKFLALQQQQDELGVTNQAVAKAGEVLGGGAPGAPPAASAARTINPPPSVMPAPASPLAVNPAQSAPQAPAMAPPAPTDPAPQNPPIATPKGAIGYPRDENEARANIQKISEVLNTRNLPKSSQDVLDKHLAANIKFLEEKDPAEVRTLDALTKRPELLKTDIARRQASKPETNINTKVETEEGKEQGAATVDMFKTVAKQGTAAREQLAQLNQLGDLSTKIKTGGPAAAQAALADYGIKVGKNVGAVEAYSAIIDKMTPAERIPGSGSSSDFDAKMFKKGLPGLINSPEGNQIVRGSMIAIQEDRIAHAKIAQRYLTRQITSKQALDEAAALPDPYAAFKSWQSQQDAKPQGFGSRFDASRPTSVAPNALEEEMRRRGLK